MELAYPMHVAAPVSHVACKEWRIKIIPMHSLTQPKLNSLDGLQTKRRAYCSLRKQAATHKLILRKTSCAHT
eukprot:1148472-Pelagomonas_calceolata.AAC.8